MNFSHTGLRRLIQLFLLLAAPAAFGSTTTSNSVTGLNPNGFAVSSHNPSQVATAAFRDFHPVDKPGFNPAIAMETLGQSSRRTSVVFSEIMYHPTNATLEFVELYILPRRAAGPEWLPIGRGYWLHFSPGNRVAGRRVSGDCQFASGFIDGIWTHGSAGSLHEYPAEFRWHAVVAKPGRRGFPGGGLSDRAPWPEAADGTGHSLVLARPSYGENNPLAWRASDSIGGSPGGMDTVPSDPLRNVVINEILAHTDFPEVDYIELYNHSTQPLNIGGCILTDDFATNKFVIAQGTTIPAHGFVYYTETNMNFSLNAAGETIYFKNAAQTRVLDVLTFDAQENGVSLGRYPDGAEQFYRLTAKTPGGTNSNVRINEVVINELMYKPITGDDNDQYIELYNRSAAPVNLGGWKLSDAVSYTFPTNTVIPADGYLVVGRLGEPVIGKISEFELGKHGGKF